MQRTALVLGLVALLSVAACGGSQLPSSGVSATTLPSSSIEAAASGSTPPSASASAETATDTPSPSESPSDTPSPSPTASPSPTPTPTPTPIPVCTSSQLTAKVTGWQGAMGSQIASVKLVNASSAGCRLQGTPGLQLVDAGGHILIDSKTAGASGLPHVSPGDKTWTLGQGGWVTTMVQVSDYCGATVPILPTTIAFILPSNGGRLVAAAGPGGSVPPCFGNPGDPGTIQMNGWAH